MTKVSGVKLKNKRGKTLKATWNRTKGSSGYQIQIAKNRSFTKGKSKSITYSTRYEKYGLKKKKKYFVRVRAYGYQGNRIKYGKWSVVKKIVIRK